jgi:signal transduction histidine kinase
MDEAEGKIVQALQMSEKTALQDFNGLPQEISQDLPALSATSPLSQAQEDFISTISHEFRTPLTSIKGFADTLLNYGAQLPEEEKRRFISIIKAQADRLIRLVENLLTVSRMGGQEASPLDYRPVLLRPLLERVTQSVQAKCRSKGQAMRLFEVDCQPRDLAAWADADLLEQVLLNLVDNAAKYSPPERPVQVQAGFSPDAVSLEHDGMHLQIHIRDFGRGIPADQLPQIFTRFYRVEAPLSQDVEGTGLGLYIAQSLTQAMGGHLSVMSEVATGSVFTVTLPVATPERQAVYQKRRHRELYDE